MHVRYAVLIGVLAAILDVIPYVGAVATFIPAVSVAFIDHGPGVAVIVAVLFIAIFELEGHLIAPNIVSKTVSLSPLAVILAILIGGELMGIFGMFIAFLLRGCYGCWRCTWFRPKRASTKPNLLLPRPLAKTWNR